MKGRYLLYPRRLLPRRGCTAIAPRLAEPSPSSSRRFACHVCLPRRPYRDSPPSCVKISSLAYDGAMKPLMFPRHHYPSGVPHHHRRSFLSSSVAPHGSKTLNPKVEETLPVSDRENGSTPSQGNSNSCSDDEMIDGAIGELLSPPPGCMSVEQVLEAVEAIRWLVGVERTPRAVEQAFRLYRRIFEETAVHNPELLLLKGRGLGHWFTGNYPKAMHLLNHVLDGWRICCNNYRCDRDFPSPGEVLKMVERMSSTVKEMNDRDDDRGGGWGKTGGAGFLLNDRTYGIILSSAVQRMPRQTKEEKRAAPIFCGDVLDTMLREGSNNPKVLPDTKCFNKALEAWSRSGREDAAEGAEGLLDDMKRLYEDGVVVDAIPNAETYMHVIKALTTSAAAAERGGRERMESAERIAREMMTRPYPGVDPDWDAYALLVRGWASVVGAATAEEEEDPTYYALDRGYGILKEMIDLSRRNDDIRVDARPFSELICAVARHHHHLQRDDLLDEAEEIYLHLVRLFEEQTNGRDAARFRPDVSVLSAMHRVYTARNKVEEAEAVTRDLDELSMGQRQWDHPLSAPGGLRRIIDGWASSGHADAAVWAEKMLLNAIEAIEADGGGGGAEHHRRDVIRSCAHEVLRLWSRSERGDAGRRAEALLRILQFSLGGGSKDWTDNQYMMYGHVMKAWSNIGKNGGKISDDDSPKAAEKIETLLFELKRMYDQGIRSARPHGRHYTMAIDAWGKNAERRGGGGGGGFFAAADDDPAGHVEDLFQDALDCYYREGNEACRPNRALYCAVIQAFGIIRDGERAEKYFRMMVDDFITASSSSSSSSSGYGGQKQAGAAAAPHAGSLNLVLLAWLRSRDAARGPERAYRILEDVKVWNEKGLVRIIPDEKTRELVREIQSMAQ